MRTLIELDLGLCIAEPEISADGCRQQSGTQAKHLLFQTGTERWLTVPLCGLELAA
jgi:hypothetical protein